jgi:putative membrane protein
MKNIFALSLAAALVWGIAGCDDNRRAKNYNEKTMVDDEGLGFIKKAHEAGLTEIRAATVAQQKSQNPRVVNFAKMMITDHKAMGNEIKKLADEKYVNYKSDTDTLNPEHQQMVQQMSSLSGAAFDKAYMQMMVADHGKVIQMFRQATNNKIKEINDLAVKSLPKLTAHLDSAKAINASLK